MGLNIKRCETTNEQYEPAGVLHEKEFSRELFVKKFLQQAKRAVLRMVETQLYHHGIVELEEMLFGYSKKELARLKQENYEKYLAAKMEIARRLGSEMVSRAHVTARSVNQEPF